MARAKAVVSLDGFENGEMERAELGFSDRGRNFGRFQILHQFFEVFYERLQCLVMF